MIKTTIDIRIDAIKRLKQAQLERSEDRDSSAILCSSYHIDLMAFSKMASVIDLQFDDTTNERSNRCFTHAIAKCIKDYIENLNDTAILYICCDSGESRSTAIAAAVMRSIGQDEMIIWGNPHYHPNPLVYKRQCEAFGIRVPEVELQYKKRINDNALSKAIRDSQR